MTAPAMLPAVAVFHHTREPDPSWVRALTAVSPVTDRTSHLRLVWEPGTPEAPVQRWMLYECLPDALVCELIAAEEAKGNDESKLAVLRAEALGPDPRTLTHVDRITGRIEAQTLLTRQQWDLYRAHGVLGSPFWCIQGAAGGHKLRFSEPERKLLELAGLPQEPPAPGDLPYAPFDARVEGQILRADRLAAVGHRLVEHRRRASAAGHQQGREEAERQYRAQLVDWLKAQVQEAATEIAQTIRRHDELQVGPRTTVDYDRVVERATESFITTGRV